MAEPLRPGFLTPISPYYGLSAMYWHKMRQDDLNAFYGAPYGGGGGTTSIDVPGSVAGFPGFTGAATGLHYLVFQFQARSADGSIVTLHVEWSGAKGSSESKHKVWRILGQQKKETRPAEWHPGGARLPGTRAQIHEDVYLLLLRDASNVIHARLLFASELQGELFDLADPITSAKKSSGLWP